MKWVAKFFMWCDKNQLEWVAISAGVLGVGVVSLLWVYMLVVVAMLAVK